MSIRNVFCVLVVSAEVIALSACISDNSPNITAVPDPGFAGGHDRGFIWSADKGVQLIPQPSYAQSMVVRAINNHGEVVGALRPVDGREDYRAFIWSAKDGLQRLGSLAGPEGESTALTINDDSEVRGLSDGPSTQGGPEGRVLHDAFIWTADAGMKPTTWTRFGDLKPVSEGGNLRMPPGAECMQVTGASPSGLAIGFAGLIQPATCNETTVLMWELDGTPIVIDQCTRGEGCGSDVAAINNRGQVVGYRAGHGFRWTRTGGFVQMPIQEAFPTAINDNGDVAAVIFNDADYSTKPIVWMASGEIKTITPPQGATTGTAIAINNSGQVTGTFR